MACPKCISIPIVGGCKFNKFGNGYILDASL